MSTDAARTADGDWEADCAEHGIPDADALRQIWRAAYGTGYQATTQHRRRTNSVTSDNRDCAGR